MSLKWPAAGPGNHASFGISGLPYATSSILAADTLIKLSFDYVTKFFYVVNDGPGDLRVGFTQNGVSSSAGLGTNYFLVPANTESPQLEIRCRELFIYAPSVLTASVCAGLTAIPSSDYYSVTGSQYVSGSKYLSTGVG